jgi:hypothetical protein
MFRHLRAILRERLCPREYVKIKAAMYGWHILLNHIAAFVFSNFNLVFLYWMVDFVCCGDDNLMFVREN